MMKNKLIPFGLWCVFECVALTLWVTKNNIFYLYNFSYIGTCLMIGLYLLINGKPWARRFIQLGVGSYMLIYLGLICQENMQLEGFWYYLFKGTFEAATIHYLVAKIAGPLLFGRGWCGYACWHAMVFDLLPYKHPRSPRKHFGSLRIIVFIASLLTVLFVMKTNTRSVEHLMFVLFIIGNCVYYLSGILLALVLKDNRAFCKYICPVTVFLKPMSYYSLLRVHCDEEKCVHCQRCLKVCPMDVEVNKDARGRKNATECILCYECTKVCPTKALH